MEMRAFLESVLPVETGVSKAGSEWKKATALFKTDGQYPKTVALELWGDKIAQAQSFKTGALLNVGVDLESREYNGKWYLQGKVWKLSPVGAEENRAANAAAASSAPALSQPTIGNPPSPEDDDLPF